MNQLRAGDLVEVKKAEEILQTLDEDGALNHLPFMPEMTEFCGQRFRVSQRVVKTCFSGAQYTILAFNTDDVVTLEGLRCSGAAHDGCQKSCMIFWREAWLRRVEHNAQTPGSVGHLQALKSRLKTTSGENVYFCQASELLKAARQLSRPERVTTCFKAVRARNCSAFHMVREIGIWLVWRIRRSILGVYARGNCRRTPTERLDVQAGEAVQVKPIREIVATLNQRAQNRGLYFTPDMRRICGRTARVRNRIDKIIVDGTGEMRRLHNTVYLEGTMCGCAHVAFGGCPRGEFSYWREIWLRRGGRT